MGTDKRPLIAIVGSVDKTRTGELNLRNVENAAPAAQAIGAQLAKQGYRIIVYSREPRFIEGDFVRGYVTSGVAKPGSIRICAPSHQHERYPEEAGETADLFDKNIEPDENWEVPFYKSLEEADGIILMGGGNTTLIAGTIALTRGQALLALGGFGGQAEDVLKRFPANAHPAPEDDRHLMSGFDGQQTADAEKLVKSLTVQRKIIARKEQAEAHPHGNTWWILGMVAMVAIAGGASIFFFSKNIWTGLGFMGLPMLGGAAGALAQFTRKSKPQSAKPPSIGDTIFRGMFAGFVTSMGLLLSNTFASLDIGQLADQTNADVRNRIVIFNLFISLISGFTLEKTLRAIQGVDVGKHITTAARTSEPADSSEKSEE